MKKLIGLCALSLLLTGCSSSTAEPTPTSTPEVKKLTADYDGATKGGTMIDDDNKGVHVYLEESGGEKEEVTGWHIKNPTPLKAGENNSITVWYEDDYCILYIQADNSLELLEAVYDGETREGTVLDKDNKGIHVYYTDEEGKKSEVDDWNMVGDPATLAADEISSIIIEYNGLQFTLRVKGTEYVMTDEEYKEACKEISYNDLARYPGKYENEYIRVYGQILQVIEGEDNEVQLRVATKKSDYGSDYYDDVIYVFYFYNDDDPKFLEDDFVTLWGVYANTSTYTSTMGGEITIPAMYARIAEIQ